MLFRHVEDATRTPLFLTYWAALLDWEPEGAGGKPSVPPPLDSTEGPLAWAAFWRIVERRQ